MKIYEPLFEKDVGRIICGGLLFLFTIVLLKLLRGKKYHVENIKVIQLKGEKFNKINQIRDLDDIEEA